VLTEKNLATMLKTILLTLPWGVIIDMKEGNTFTWKMTEKW